MVSLLKISKFILFGVEGIMTENAFMISKVNFVEVVHVELSDKRGKPVVAIVAREHSLLEFLLIDNSDAFSLWVPDDGFAMLF